MVDGSKARSAVALAIVIAMIALVLFSFLSPVVVYATINTVNGEVATLVVPITCIPVITNTLITFPQTQAGLSASTSNAENVMNTGNAASNILVDGGNWVSSSPAAAFLVSNTLWDLRTRAANNGNQLTNSITGTDTFVFISGTGTASNVVFFGVNVPSGQVAATYVQTINVLLSC